MSSKGAGNRAAPSVSRSKRSAIVHRDETETKGCLNVRCQGLSAKNAECNLTGNLTRFCRIGFMADTYAWQAYTPEASVVEECDSEMTSGHCIGRLRANPFETVASCLPS